MLLPRTTTARVNATRAASTSPKHRDRHAPPERPSSQAGCIARCRFLPIGVVTTKTHAEIEPPLLRRVIGLLLKRQRGRVHAVPQARRFRSIGKDVSEVRVAAAADNF